MALVKNYISLNEFRDTSFIKTRDLCANEHFAEKKHETFIKLTIYYQ